jgi:hypothetical protein
MMASGAMSGQLLQIQRGTCNFPGLEPARDFGSQSVAPDDAGRLRGPDFFTIRLTQHDRPDLIRLHVERVEAHAELYDDCEAKLCDPDHAVELGTAIGLDAAPHVLGA